MRFFQRGYPTSAIACRHNSAARNKVCKICILHHPASICISLTIRFEAREDEVPQIGIPCTYMRGGTSKGPFFRAEDLPIDPAARDAVLLAVMGSPDRRQIDGLGGADSLTSKVAIISPSARPDVDVDYLFAQVKIEQSFVDTAPNCGNMLAGVGPFAIENGMVPPEEGETLVRVFNVNTSSIVHVLVQTPGRMVRFDGSAAIDGVPGAGSPILLNFVQAVGSKTGALLPTGNAKDTVEGIEVSCVDLAVPMVIARATDFGKTGAESRDALNADRELFQRIEVVRRAAALRMGMGDVTGKVVPKFCLVSPPLADGTITSRYLVPDSCHAAHAVTGALCLSAACGIPGSVTEGIADLPPGPRRQIIIEHPSGTIATEFEMTGPTEAPVIKRAALVRTARKLMEGKAFVPEAVWSGLRLDASTQAA